VLVVVAVVNRGHPNLARYASDVRLHPTIYEGRSSSAPALHVVHGVCVRPAVVTLSVCEGHSHDSSRRRFHIRLAVAVVV
jgi:hypothetical protein